MRTMRSNEEILKDVGGSTERDWSEEDRSRQSAILEVLLDVRAILIDNKEAIADKECREKQWQIDQIEAERSFDKKWFAEKG